MTTNAFDSIRFIEIYKNSRNKNVLIEDKVYNLLEDIYNNPVNIDIHYKAYDYKLLLCDSVSYDKNNIFIINYTNALQDCIFLEILLKWLNTINPNHFEYKNLQYIRNYEDDYLVKIICDFILFDDWWEDFVKLRKEVERIYNELLLKQ